MKRIMILVLVTLGFVMCDTGYPSTTLRVNQIPNYIEVVKAQGQPRHPYQDEYERMLYPTVRITAGFSTGSGVVISVPPGAPPSACSRPSLRSGERGAYSVEGITILTAAHVVEDETTVNIELYNATVITGTVVITDTIRDLALIKPSGLMSYSAQLAPRKYTPYLFTPVWAVGCSLGLPPRPSQGIISVIESGHWEVTSPILPGNSGGPVYDARTYEVIGIAVWVKVYNGQLITTMAGIVTIQNIHTFLEQVKN